MIEYTRPEWIRCDDGSLVNTAYVSAFIARHYTGAHHVVALFAGRSDQASIVVAVRSTEEQARGVLDQLHELLTHPLLAVQDTTQDAPYPSATDLVDMYKNTL